MKLAPVNWIDVAERNAVNAPGGVYVHAREVAAWLRDNDLDEYADALEGFAGEAEAKAERAA